VCDGHADKVRINVVDLMKLQSPSEHPHSLTAFVARGLLDPLAVPVLRAIRDYNALLFDLMLSAAWRERGASFGIGLKLVHSSRARRLPRQDHGTPIHRVAALAPALLQLVDDIVTFTASPQGRPWFTHRGNTLGPESARFYFAQLKENLRCPSLHH
jgi:hypothetical protein